MTSSIGSTIISALGTGSGINTTSLVSSLVSAVRDPKETLITGKQTLNNTRISAMASAISSLDTFSSTLTSILQDTAYSGQPASSDTSIASVSTLTGGTPTGLPAQIEVKQLAQAQVLKSTTLASATEAVGQGTLTLTTASGSYTIAIDSSNDNLSGMAQGINATNSGVTATVMTDASGSRLVLKGQTGADNGFTLTKEATDTADANLERFTFDGTSGAMTQTQSAQNAVIVLDGVEMEYADNVVKDAIPFLRIDLNKAAPGTTVTLATNEPTSTITDLLNDFVTAYNTLRSALNDATAGATSTTDAGALAGDSSIRQMKTMLSKLTTTQLATSGTYKTLSDIGISTNNDGTLSLDSDRLAAAFDADPTGVTQLINPTTSTTDTLGLAAAVENIKTSLEADNGVLSLAQDRYEALAEDYADQLEKLDRDMVDYQTRLSAIYSALDSRLTAFKATQSYLEQQISAWNNSDN
ncbi:MAG: flagellar hook protein [Sphingomonadales bacterium]|nr:MAG: flagellar hook protein [Sphingomonadales bacterium]TNF06036.1 MAG: flagellar hook protein [Sphingomonadales bacterium]